MRSWKYKRLRLRKWETVLFVTKVLFGEVESILADLDTDEATWNIVDGWMYSAPDAG